MNLFTIKTQTALALLVAASLPQIAHGQHYDPFAADVRSGDSAASHYSDPAVDAMGARYDAMATSYASRPAASYLSAAAVKAMGERYQAQVAANDSTANAGQPVRPDDRGGIRGVEEPQVAAAASSGSFDWTDASIGAASGLGLSLLLVGGLVLGLSTRREHRIAQV
jgi:hypothetical protein